MLKNYFTIAINNLIKNKLFSAINIIGLAVGLAACIISTLYVQNELSYDNWEKADLIYRINQRIRIEGTHTNTSVLFLPALKKYFPEDIEFGTRIMNYYREIQIGDMCYPASYAKVDEDFVNIFHFEELKGSLKSTLQAPGNIALSEESADKYFSDKNPIGEIITFKSVSGNSYTFDTSLRNIPPSLIAYLYKTRWDIEKSFDEVKNKLSEKKHGPAKEM